MKPFVLVLLALLVVHPAGADGDAAFRYVALQVDAQGKSHFVDSQSALNPRADGITETDPLQASTASFMRLAPRYSSAWHNAPVPLYLLILQGTMTVEAGSGERRTFSTGDVILFGDTTGQGHQSTVGADGVLFAMVQTK